MSTITNSTNRVAGLMSGLDTEELVKAMTANTKNRINSQKQKLQLLQWRQESYRSVISKISDFKNKYLDILSSTSIKAAATMNKYIATSSNEKIIKATAAAGATPGTYTISKATSATAATLTSEKVNGNPSVAAGEIKLNFGNTKEGIYYGVNVELDGVTKEITFKGGANADESRDNFLNALNDNFKEVLGSNQKFEWKLDENGNKTSTLKFNDGDDGILHTFSVGYGVGVGLANTAYSRISTTSTLGEAAFAQELKSADGKYNININGVEFEFDENTKISDMINTINKSDAGVTLSFSNVSQSFTLKANSTGAASEINVYQTNGNLLNAMFNWGDEFAATSADRAKVTYDVLDDGMGVRPGKSVRDLLRNGFGDDDNGIYQITFQDTDKRTYVLDLDIKSRLPKKEDGADPDKYTDEEITAAFNDALREAYKAKTLEEDGVAKELDENLVIFDCFDDSLYVRTKDYLIDFGTTDGFGGFTNLVKGKAAPPSYQITDDGVTSMEFKVNGETVTVEAKEGASGITIQDLIDKGVFKMPSNGTLIASADIDAVDENAKAFLRQYFGKDDESGYSLIGAKDGDIKTVTGTNSTLTISADGGQTFATYTSTSSSFTFDGTTINIAELQNFEATDPADWITVETTKDTSGVVDIIKGFVEDYNTLLADLYKEMGTNRPKSNGDYFDPLTEEMEDEMSDKEIEKWNENAKTGLLYRDTNIQRFLSDLRGAMTTRVNGFGLSDLGINVSGAWTENGKLELNETALQNALEKYGDEITKLFTGADGLAAKLENVVDKAISTKAKKYGYLSSLAGIEGTKTDKDNQIYKQIEYIQKIIEKLNEKYENEQNRYWRKYSALETYMARAQSQMSYFTDFTSGNGY